MAPYLQTSTNIFLCLAIPHWLFILFSFRHEAVLLKGLKLWLYCMVTSWQIWRWWPVACTEDYSFFPVQLQISQSLFPSYLDWMIELLRDILDMLINVPEGNIPQKEMDHTRKHTVWQLLHQRKLTIYMRLMVQIFSPRAHRKQHGRCLTFLQAASSVLLRKARELWLNITV